MVLFFGTVANAQSPAVSITVDSVSATTVSASFVKNSGCDDYYFLIDDGGLGSWASMMGATVGQLVEMWGIHATGDTSYTWTELAAATPQMIYVSSNTAAGKVLDSLATSTAVIGGDGASVITIQVSDITGESARVVCTANDQTSVFYDQLIEKTFFLEIGQDSAIAIVKESMFPQYEVDDWVWAGLTPSTAYYALAIGQNINGDWGDLAMAEFTTSSANGISESARVSAKVYPNPTTDKLTIELGDVQASVVELYDMSGRKMMSRRLADNARQVSIDMTSLSAGNYVVRLASEGRSGESLVVVKQ